ncbi:uv excision repair protein rad23 [Anaeramoeba flamelloides]|uniref:Uv excision repair protein rad23 n=1 Tax=Anaeramoeba flamelloides TaxID=1746091 RepID=A0AAV7YKR8_9EUKA|nr:uv excision repair protein rad23 [Anaeramoeba flamelloides]
MSQNEKKNELDGKIQECPHCKCFIPKTDIGFGFKECNECQTIFCFFCCESFGRANEECENQNLQMEENEEENFGSSLNKEKERKKDKQTEAMIHYNSVHKSVHQTYKTRNFHKFVRPRNNFQVHIKPLTNFNFSIEVNKYDSIKKVKEKIFQKNGYPIKDQGLFYLSQILPNKSLVCECGIKADSVLHILFRPKSRSYILKIKTLDGIFFSIKADQKTLSSIQEKVFDKTNIEIENQVFLYKGQQLGTNIEFKELGIKEDSLVYLLPLEHYTKCSIRGIYNRAFLQLLEDSKNALTDLEIMGQKIHSLMLKTRTKKDPGLIKSMIEEKYHTIEERNLFLNWVYGDKDFKNKKLHQILKDIGMAEMPSKETLLEDISELWNDQDSKDFKILINGNDQGNKDQDKLKNENADSIPIHKIVLRARSQLFKTMFSQVNKNINKVTDYSGISFESLQILFKFLYTNKIEITADNDPILVLEELQDAKDYYQLGKNSVLDLELQKIKSKVKK